MGTKNQDAALDVIGQKLRLKEEIDRDFNEVDIIDKDLEIQDSHEEDTPKAISYKLNTKDAGFNCLCELNLGKAYKYTCEKDEEGNIINEKRCYYPKSYKLALNEKWLDYMLEQIKNATNPVVVISDIFTRVTTGNVDETLPYKEQLAYIYKKLNDEKLKDKIVALVRGSKELDIIKNNGPDLMLKLANMLGMKNKLVDSGFQLVISVNNVNTHNDRPISLLQFPKKINSVRTLAISMQKYENENPGHDIYFCTNAKINWYSSGVTTTTDENGNTIQKPCWFISFGGVYEYDKFNEKRPEIGPYTLNKDWFKITVDEKSFVRVDSVNYTYPSSTKIDTSSYTASKLTENMQEKFKDVLNLTGPAFDEMMEKLKKLTRKQIVSAINNKPNKKQKSNIEMVEQKNTENTQPENVTTEDKGEEKL